MFKSQTTTTKNNNCALKRQLNLLLDPHLMKHPHTNTKSYSETSIKQQPSKKEKSQWMIFGSSQQITTSLPSSVQLHREISKAARSCQHLRMAAKAAKRGTFDQLRCLSQGLR